MNKMIFLAVITLSLLLIVVPPPSFAQDATCPDLVQNAYELTQEVCEAIGDDEACYGNLTIDVQPDSIAFSEPGDLTDVGEIESLRLTSMSVESQEWGISLIHVQVLASENDAPQGIELVLFGNVEIENAAEEGSDFASLQAFTFRSGVADRPCDEAPDSGLMIQTPAGVGEITLLVNEVTIDLGSTAFLQAEPGNEMAIRIVDGQADVTAQGSTIAVPSGAQARVPLDANGLADGPPQGPEPYDEDSLQTLPVPLLSEQIAIAPALEDDAATGGSAQGDGLTPIAGTWTSTDCGGGSSEVTIAVDGDEMTWAADGSVTTFTRTEPGIYQYASADGQDLTGLEIFIRFDSISEDRMEGAGFSASGECSAVFER